MAEKSRSVIAGTHEKKKRQEHEVMMRIAWNHIRERN
jgi:hypothetical protein